MPWTSEYCIYELMPWHPAIRLWAEIKRGFYLSPGFTFSCHLRERRITRRDISRQWSETSRQPFWNHFCEEANSNILAEIKVYLLRHLWRYLEYC